MDDGFYQDSTYQCTSGKHLVFLMFCKFSAYRRGLSQAIMWDSNLPKCAVSANIGRGEIGVKYRVKFVYIVCFEFVF